jgi:hypothetical protein
MSDLLLLMVWVRRREWLRLRDGGAGEFEGTQLAQVAEDVDHHANL